MYPFVTFIVSAVLNCSYLLIIYFMFVLKLEINLNSTNKLEFQVKITMILLFTAVSLLFYTDLYIFIISL
jgi:hypothetical protein